MTFFDGTAKVGGRGYFIETRFWREGRLFFFEKGLRATRASTLSPDSGGSSLAALFSGEKMTLRQVRLRHPSWEKGVKAFFKASLLLFLFYSRSKELRRCDGL